MVSILWEFIKITENNNSEQCPPSSKVGIVLCCEF